MTNDADDNRPPGELGSSPDPQQGTRRARGGWSDAGPETSGTGAETPETEGPTIQGTPTPGQQNPTGRREENPAIIARPLAGTTPKATNERPQAPAGANSAPTTPRPVVTGPGEISADLFRPAPTAASAANESGSEDPEARPENPFAPKDEAPRKRRFPRPTSRPRQPESTPEGEAAGKRAAEPATKLLSLDRFRRGGAGAGAGDERQPLGARNVTALAIAGVAIVAVIALITSTLVWWFNRTPEAAGPQGPNLVATPAPVLSPGQMLSDSMAKDIDPTRTWTQTLDQTGDNDSSPGIACIGPRAADQPIPEVTQLRGLSASGTDRTAVLHRANAYATNEEAQKAFAFHSAELGSCTDTSLYVEKGMTVTGVGDQSLGVRLVLQDVKPEYHTVLLVRTGRVVNLLDVARTGAPVDMTAQLKALGQSVNRQCGPAIGLCTSPVTSVSVGIPPAGGEQPGFLTSGDIPRITPGSGSWRGNPLSTRIDVQDGSGCEAVDFSTVGGTGVTRQQRTYLLRNDSAAPPQFGIDQVVLTMGSPTEAADLVNKINGNMSSCTTRTLTSQMTKTAPLSTPGDNGIDVRGQWFIVNTKIDQANSQRYRVSVFSAGNKFVYLRSNPTERFDFSDDSWIGVSLRAGERATQVK